MKRLYVCTPYTGDPDRNMETARALCRKALAAGFAPFSPRILCAGLDVSLTPARLPGLRLGLSYLPICQAVWAYVGGGVTPGLARELRLARRLGKPIFEFFNLSEPAPSSLWFGDDGISGLAFFDGLRASVRDASKIIDN